MGANLSRFSDRYLAARARVDELNDALKEANAEKGAAEKALADAMTLAGVTSIKTDDGVGLTAIRKKQYSCPAENKDALYAALRERNMDYLFSVPAATLNKFAKDMAEQNGGALDEPFAELMKLYDEEVGVQVRDFKKWGGGST